MARIVVVEDEPALRGDLVEHLQVCGHDVRGADSGAQLDGLLAQEPADLLVLDVNLPGEDGFKIAKRLRERSEVGIIMLTARSMIVDRVVGLEVGADVYLVKPVDLRELEAQVKTLLRRLKTQAAPAPEAAEDPAPAAQMLDDGWAYDQLSWTLVSPTGGRMRLTATERVFIQLLVARPGEPVSRTEIFRALGKREWEPGDRSIDSLVRRLRQRGEEELGCSVPIQSVHGVGYAFASAVVQRAEG